MAKASKLMEKGNEVPVMVVPEPDNEYDSKAIAFKINVKLMGNGRGLGT